MTPFQDKLKTFCSANLRFGFKEPLSYLIRLPWPIVSALHTKKLSRIWLSLAHLSNKPTWWSDRPLANTSSSVARLFNVSIFKCWDSPTSELRHVCSKTVYSDVLATFHSRLVWSAIQLVPRVILCFMKGDMWQLQPWSCHMPGRPTWIYCGPIAVSLPLLLGSWRRQDSVCVGVFVVSSATCWELL